MQTHITYFVHGTTTDNEKHLSSGWKDVGLSKLGIRQSEELKDLIKGKRFDVVFCSDLKRAVQSANITFKGKVKIIKDKRLRECNYSTLNGAKSEIVDALTEKSISKPFPNGESYKDVEKRLRDFLKYLSDNYPGKEIAIVSHKGPQLALDVILKGKTWKQAIKEDWRLKGHKGWKPGWEYNLETESANSFGGFGKLAIQYDNFRPSYPKKVISFIYDNVETKQPNILDLGCGTGISTRQLAKNKGVFIGYDPDKEMLSVAEKQTKNKPNISYVIGKAEKLPFENAYFDGVTAFTSFHWFMNKKAIEGIKRILKPSGVLCIVQPRYTSLQKDYRIILERELHLKIPKNYKISKEIVPFLTENGFGIKKKTFESDIKYTLNEYLSLLKSYSLWNYVPVNRKQEMEELLKKHFKTKLKGGYIRNIRYVEVIVANMNRKLILIDGGPASGKNTLSELLVKDLNKSDYKAILLDLDTYVEKYNPKWVWNNEGQKKKDQLNARIDFAWAITKYLKSNFIVIAIGERILTEADYIRFIGRLKTTSPTYLYHLSVPFALRKERLHRRGPHSLIDLAKDQKDRDSVKKWFGYVYENVKTPETDALNLMRLIRDDKGLMDTNSSSKNLKVKIVKSRLI